MKHILSASIALIIFAALITAVPHETQSQSKTGCTPQPRNELVFTVVDKNGSVIENLRAEHLSLKFGKANATISDVVFRKTDQPLDLVVLIDASVSQERVLALAKAGAQSFISSVASAGRDRVAIVSFSSKPGNRPVLSSNFVDATVAIGQIKIDAPPGYVGGGVVVGTTPPRNRGAGSTSLWDVIQSTAQALFVANAENRRRAMLVFSDGTDTASKTTLNAAIDEAIKHDMVVFSIGLADSNFSINVRELKKLSEETGGVASFPKKKEAVETALTEIAKRLSANYVVGYCGEWKGKPQLEVADPEIRKTQPVLAYKRLSQ